MRHAVGRNRYLALLMGLLSVPVIALALPVSVAAESIARQTARRRLVRAAQRRKCPGCGAILGREAVRMADRLCFSFSDTLERENPDAEFTVVRRVDVVCPGCKSRYHFEESDGVFEPVCAEDPPCRLAGFSMDGSY